MPAHLIKTCRSQHSHNNIKCATFMLKQLLLLNFWTNPCFKMVYVSKIEHFFSYFFLHFKILKCPNCIPVAYTWPIQPINWTLHLRFEDFTAVTVFCNATHCSWLQLLQMNLLTSSSTNHMGLAGSSEKLVTNYQNTQHHMLELHKTAQFGKKAFQRMG